MCILATTNRFKLGRPLPINVHFYGIMEENGEIIRFLELDCTRV